MNLSQSFWKNNSQLQNIRKIWLNITLDSNDLELKIL